jgi:N-methylhydantoinase A
MQVAGPAIVTELDSTTVVLPHHVATVDRYYNLLINRI